MQVNRMTVCCKLEGQEAAVIHKVAETLCELSALPLHRPKTSFDSESPPPISLSEYVERLWKYMDCGIQCFVIGTSYIRRILETHPEFRVGLLNVHTLTLSSLVVAIKFHEDSFRTNAYYARVGGVSAVALHSLEIAFMKLLDWRATCTEESLRRCCDLLFCEDRQYELRAICQVPGINVQAATATGAADTGGNVGGQSRMIEVAATASGDYLGRSDGSHGEMAERESSRSSIGSCNEMRHDAPSDEMPGPEPEQKDFYKLAADKIASTSTVCSLLDVD